MSHDELTPLRTDWSALASALGVIAAVTGVFPHLVGTVPMNGANGQRVSLRRRDFTHGQVATILAAMPSVTLREHCSDGTWIRTLEGELAECWPIELFEIIEGPTVQGPAAAGPIGGWMSGGMSTSAPTIPPTNAAGWLEPRPTPFPRNRGHHRWARTIALVSRQV